MRARPRRVDRFSLRTQRDLATAVWATWGRRGLRRRAGYELTRRTGVLRWRERHSSTTVSGPTPVGVTPHTGLHEPEGGAAGGRTVRLYGALELDVRPPIAWHRHPLTGHRFPPDAHWSTFSDAAPEAGDVKDLWELSRFGWLQPQLRSWAVTGDDAIAERIWGVLEHWIAQNPPFRGPHWMCGQETSLRAITALFLTDALATSRATTTGRRALTAGLVAHSVARVVPSLGYALSQRNNHAISEAGFLWTATLMVDGLPAARHVRRRAAQALTEAVTDQFADDGSYAQHSPTYQRLALHVLLWCLHVARSTGVPPPAGSTEAVARSVPFLRSLLAPGSEGRVPNMGGNDGALLFDLAPAAITDLRPVIAHAAAATGQPSGLEPGPWDAELRWFGLTPTTSGAPAPQPATESTHPLTRGTTHVVVRAGPLRHRPANADQLHTDVWIAGSPVAVDPGSFRYTAPAPWGAALSGEEVHNLPRRDGAPQAVRSGRFFWRRWTTARVAGLVDAGDVAAIEAALVLPDDTRINRMVAVRDGLVVVVDHATSGIVVRWNLAAGATVTTGPAATMVQAEGWVARLVHGGVAEVLEPTEDIPTSGWHAPTYGIREPLSAVIVPSDDRGRVVSCFARADLAVDLIDVADAASATAALDLGSATDVRRLLCPD